MSHNTLTELCLTEFNRIVFNRIVFNRIVSHLQSTGKLCNWDVIDSHKKIIAGYKHKKNAKILYVCMNGQTLNSKE